MKIYISGKITGLPIQAVKEKFLLHSEILRLKGHDPVNPIEISPFCESKSWNDNMLEDIKHLFKCDAIYMLDDWGQSKGAKIEYSIAEIMGLKIFFEGDKL